MNKFIAQIQVTNQVSPDDWERQTFTLELKPTTQMIDIEEWALAKGLAPGIVIYIRTVE